MCAVNGHNQTDSNPAPPKMKRIKKKKPKKIALLAQTGELL